MSFSQTDLDRIEAAIASGTLTVKYADKQVTYQSLTDLMKARDLIRKSLGAISKTGFGYITSTYNKGLNDT